MRLMIMFDLPTLTSEDRRNYRRFRKALVNEGFLMMQYSVYVRICPNRKSAQFLEQRVSVMAPTEGLIQTLIVTEKQYQSMHFLAGQGSTDILNSPNRTVII